MIPYKENTSSKVFYEINIDSNSECDDNQINIMDYWSKTIDQIDIFLIDGKYFGAFQELNKLTSFLDKYYTDILDDIFLFDCVINSQFYEHIQEILLLTNEKIKLSILLFFICFSTVSKDFIFSISEMFIKENILMNYLSIKNTDKIVSYFYILLGLFCQFSEVFTEHLINSKFIEYTFKLFDKSDILIKNQIINFISKMIQNGSKAISFKKCFNYFQIFVNNLKEFYINTIKCIHNDQEKELILFILNIFENVYFNSSLNVIFLNENISQFVLDQMRYFDTNNDFFIEIFPFCVKILNYGYHHIQISENIEKIALLNIKLHHYLDISTFSQKTIIIQNLSSIICKCNKEFLDYFKDFIDLFITYVNAETNFREEIISCLKILRYDKISFLD